MTGWLNGSRIQVTIYRRMFFYWIFLFFFKIQQLNWQQLIFQIDIFSVASDGSFCHIKQIIIIIFGIINSYPIWIWNNLLHFVVGWAKEEIKNNNFREAVDFSNCRCLCPVSTNARTPIRSSYHRPSYTHAERYKYKSIRLVNEKKNRMERSE